MFYKIYPNKTNMIAIIDSGSTKSSWVFIDFLGLKESFNTSGINPIYQTSEEIFNIVNKELFPKYNKIESVEVIFFMEQAVIMKPRMKL